MDTGIHNNQNPGLGLLYLAGAIRDNHDVKVIDAEAIGLNWAQMGKIIKSVDPDIVGVTATTLSSYSQIKTVKLAQYIKPEVYTIIGGSHVSALPNKSLALTGADCAIVGEGENLIDKVVTEKPKGLIRNGGKPLWEMLDPARDLLDPAVNSNAYVGNDPDTGHPETTVMWQRGCLHNCIFCCHSVYGQSWKHRSADSICHELIELRDKYHMKSIFIYDDELIGMNIAQTEWLLEVCKAIKNYGISDLAFKSQGRCNPEVVTDELLDAMAEVNFKAMMMGCESGSNKVLKAIGKNLTTSDIEVTLKRLKNHGISTFTYWMIGNLYETPEDAMETIAFIQKIKSYIDEKHVTVFTPLPGSESWKIAMRNGWILNYDFRRYGQHGLPHCATPWMNPEEVLFYERKLIEA